MRKKLCLMLCVTMTAGLLSACGGGGNTSGASAPSQSETADTKEAETGNVETGGKTLTYAMSEEPETLDPSMNNYMNSSIVLQNLFTGLYQIGEDGSLVNGCADNYTVSEDGLEYTFTLRDGLKWSDGSDLTAKDFEYSWKRALSPDAASPGAWYLFYLKNGEKYNSGEAGAEDVGVTAVDDKTLKVTLENPTSYFLDLTAVSVYFPVKQEVVEGNGGWTKTGDTYICNGAFKVKEINPQASYILEKNPNYVDADKTKLDNVSIVFIGSAEAALSSFNAGEVDVIDNALIGTQAQTQYGGSDELKMFDLIGTNYYDFNCSQEYLSDPGVRKALAMALDRDTINQALVASKPQSAYAFVPHGIKYEGSEDDYRTVVGDLFKEDVNEAKQLLADAGYPDGAGLPTLKLITQNDQEKKDIVQAMQAMWKENLGVNTEIVTFESKVYWDEQRAGNFDICYDGWTGDYPDPSTNLECFLASRNETQCRWTGEKADRYDSIMKECRSLTDNAKRMELFTEAEQILMDEMPIMPIYFRNSQLLVNKRCANVIKSYIGHTIFKYADVQ